MGALASASMTGAPAGEWLTVDQAAAELGLSPSGFRGLAKTEHLTIRRRGSQPGVLRADVDAFIERARIQPGAVRANGSAKRRFHAHEPYARQVDGDDPPGRAEATILRDCGWDDTQIGEVVGIHFSNVSRRRVNGFTPEQIEAMRQAIATPSTP